MTDDDTGQGAVSAQVAAGTDQGGGFALGGFRVPVPQLPNVDPKRMLWLGGLGAMATIGLLEWPVAVVVGAGSIVAEQLARQNRPDQGSPAQSQSQTQ